MAMRTVDCPGMAVLADAARVTKPFAASNARYDGGRQSLRDQSRALLDVQFQVGTDLRWIKEDPPLANRPPIEAAFDQRRFETSPGVRSGYRKARRVEQSEGTATAEIRDVEPRGLFSANTHDRDITAGVDSSLLERGHHAQPRDYSRSAVVITGLRRAVEVGTDDDALGAPVASRQSHGQVADGVDRDLETDPLGRRAHDVVR